MKLKIYRAIFIILLLGAIILIALIAVKQWNSMRNEKENQEVLETFSNIEIQDSETVQLNGYDILIECYIPCIFNAEQYKKELCALSYFDEVYILPGKNLLETDLFLIKKGQRILMSKDEKIKNQTIMQTISRLAKEVVLI